MINKTLKITSFVLAVTMSVQSYAQLDTQSDFSKLIKKSWALKNTGEDQQFDLKPLQTYRFQARKGEDLNLLPTQLSPVASRKVKVAVLDTGMDVTHPYLKNRIAYNKSECAILNKYRDCLAAKDADSKACMEQYLVTGQNGVDEDGNGYPGDCHGWSTQTTENTPQNIVGTPDFSDSGGHGTHVAGLVASVSDNIEIIPVQVIADSPNEPIKPFSVDLSISEDGGRGGVNASEQFHNAEHAARGIIYAMNAGAEVISMSIGWPQANDNELIRAAVGEAQSRGIIIVAAAGNDSTQSLLRPCQYKGVICVGASRPDGSIAHFSNYGYGVDIAAPGASIISTIPMENLSVRLPGRSGIDILNGTSQATPLVAGLIADMLSRGIPSEEIYPRLILGARSVKPEMPVLEGPLQNERREVRPNRKYERYVLSGLADQKGAMSVTEKPLILNADKEIHLIQWDRKSSSMTMQFQLKNYWQDVNSLDVGLELKSKSQLAIYPEVESVQILNPENDDVWEMGEERTVEVILTIKDVQDASLSQIPSELTFVATTTVAGQKNISFEVRAEILLQLTKDVVGTDLASIPLNGKMERGFSMLLIDEVYDKKISERDYLAYKKGESAFDVQLIKYTSSGYAFGGVKNLSFSGVTKNTRLQQRIRMDVDFDGKSEYILVMQEFKEEGGAYFNGDYTMHFYILDEQFNVKKQFSFYDARTIMPLNYSWLRVGQELHPAWISNGLKVIKKWDILDLMGVDEDSEPKQGTKDIRFYYLDKDMKLANIETADKEGRIVDIIQNSLTQAQSGVLPVLVARNLGTKVKPSYLNEFSVGYIQDLKLTNTKILKNVSANESYRNLVDTNVDKVLNLQASDDEYRGTFWFGQDAHSKVRVTMIDFTNNKMHDKLLASQNTVYDSALRARSSYLGKKHAGSFLITNTEIEYHDFKSGKAAQTSLNKYTFIGDDLIVGLQFPLSVSKRGSDTKFPALFNTEGSGLSRGLKVLIPVFNAKGEPVEVIAPARFRMQTPQGCRPLEAPVFLGAQGYAMDYYCGTQILRLRLAF